MENSEKTIAKSTLNLEDRKRLTVTGVRSMGAATPSCVACRTGLGDLTVKGSQLHILKFSQEEGLLIVDGNVDSIAYAAAQDKKPFWKRMWK